MASFIVSGESAMDLPAALLQEKQIPYIPYTYTLDGEAKQDDLFTAVDEKTFFQRLRDGAECMTAALNASEYTAYFEPFLASGHDLLHVTLSSGISSTYQNALLAAKELQEKYPDRKIGIIDSMGACGGFGLLVLKLAEKRDSGASFEETLAYGEALKMKLNLWYFSSDLTFYIKGGRIRKTAGVFASALNICPLMDMDDLGFMVIREKVRTKKKVISRIVEKMLENAEDHENYHDLCVLNHADCEEDALQVKAHIEETFPALKDRIILQSIGPTIGSHCGPGTVALFYLGAERTESERSREAKGLLSE